MVATEEDVFHHVQAPRYLSIKFSTHPNHLCLLGMGKGTLRISKPHNSRISVPIGCQRRCGGLSRTVVHHGGERKKSCFLASHPDITNYLSHTTTIRPCPCLSFPALILRIYERQNDVVQHVHPRGLDFKSRLPPVPEVARTVEFCDHRLPPISGNQLHTVVQRRGFWRGRETTHPGIAHPRRTHRPSVLNAIWSSKHVTPSVRNRLNPFPDRKLGEKLLTLSTSRPGAKTRSEWSPYPEKRTYPVRDTSNRSPLSHRRSQPIPLPSCVSRLACSWTFSSYSSYR